MHNSVANEANTYMLSLHGFVVLVSVIFTTIFVTSVYYMCCAIKDDFCLGDYEFTGNPKETENTCKMICINLEPVNTNNNNSSTKVDLKRDAALVKLNADLQRIFKSDNRPKTSRDGWQFKYADPMYKQKFYY